MQRGTILKHHGSWCVRFYETVIKDGQRVRKKSFKRLAPISSDYPTKRSVLLLADKVLAPLNSGRVQPESTLSVANFIELYYLPHVQKELRPSTYLGYSKMFRDYIKDQLPDIRLRDFRTVHAQRLLREITGIGHTSLLHVKSFLSGVFKHAKREGFLDGVNPIQDASVPGRPKRFQGEVYTMSEIEAVAGAVAKVDMQAFAIISVAAFAGLRHSELRGLRWSDYDGQSLRIARSVWRTHVGPTKTEGSWGSVPVLPLLKRVLEDHRTRTNGKDDDYIFSGERLGRPLNLANLARRVIVPAVANAEIEEGDTLPKWKGFHAFRRSLASNLYSCGVST